MDFTQKYCCFLLACDLVFYLVTIGYLMGDNSQKAAAQVMFGWPLLHLPLLPLISRIMGWS